MNTFGQWRRVLARLMLSATCLVGAAARAETNLLTNSVLAPSGGSGSSTLPADWSQQGWTADSAGTHQIGPCPATQPLCDSYAYGTDADGQPYLDVTLNSTASDWSYTNLFIDNPLPAAFGENYRISVSARLKSGSPGTVALGFHLYDGAGYLSEAATNFAPQLAVEAQVADQALAYSFQVVPNYAGTGRTPTSIQPRLAIYIPPLSSVSVRIKSPLLTRGMHLSSVGIDARTGKPQLITAAPGQVLRFTTGLQGRPLAAATSIVTLVPVTPAVRPLIGSVQPITSLPLVPLSHAVSLTDPNVGDVWQVPLPANARPGTTYSIRYALKDSNSGATLALQADPDVVAYGSAGTTTNLEVGQVSIQTGGGMAIGQHFHGHPGPYGGDSRGTAPILVTYDFVRSHDSGNVGGTSWWVADTVKNNPDGLYNWSEFDRWATFHASSGQKKLLVTFFGSPTWASSNPASSNAYGIPGLTAPPANLGSYGKMVKATVARYADRIFATECWNEPSTDPTGYFNGTGTQLADVCKAIYTNTKAVDPAIPVICPAADLPWVLTQRTSQGEPLSQFCDWANGHPYDATGTDLNGEDYSVDRLGDFVDLMKLQLKQLGLNKPIALTEWGMFCDDRPSSYHPVHFHFADSATRGDLLYQMLAKAKEKGVVALGLYSYDSGTSAYLGNANTQCQFGYEGIGNYVNGAYTYDATTAASVTKAVQDFGTPLP
jgi:hypothetical protein